MVGSVTLTVWRGGEIQAQCGKLVVGQDAGKELEEAGVPPPSIILLYPSRRLCPEPASRGFLSVLLFRQCSLRALSAAARNACVTSRRHLFRQPMHLGSGYCFLLRQGVVNGAHAFPHKRSSPITNHLMAHRKIYSETYPSKVLWQRYLSQVAAL